MTIENIREGSSVIRQFIALSRRAVTSPPSHAMLKSSLRVEILNSVYSDVYLKVRQVFLETIVVVMLLSSYPLDLWTVYMNCGRRADPVQTNFIPK